MLNFPGLGSYQHTGGAVTAVGKGHFHYNSFRKPLPEPVGNQGARLRSRQAPFEGIHGNEHFHGENLSSSRFLSCFLSCFISLLQIRF
jgi:hypothetical protein